MFSKISYPKKAIWKQKEGEEHVEWGSCHKRKKPQASKTTSVKNHKRQKPQAPTLQVPIRNRQTRKVANAKVLNRNTNLT